jgi:hypothetical protein
VAEQVNHNPKLGGLNPLAIGTVKKKILKFYNFKKCANAKLRISK